jgi:hypothetical protein
MDFDPLIPTCKWQIKMTTVYNKDAQICIVVTTYVYDLFILKL